MITAQVSKAQSKPILGMSKERLDWHLRNWAGWMHSSNRGALGLPRRSVGFISGNSQDFDDMVDAVDRRCAAITNTVIGDLPPAQEGAVLVVFKISCVYRFPRGNLRENYLLARDTIASKLHLKGLW